MKPRFLLLGLLMVVQITGLAALYAYHRQGRDSEWVVRLETKPYDPRDLFRGDYINLTYPGVSDAAAGLMSKEKQTEQTLYMTLKQQGELWIKDKTEFHQPFSGTRPFLKAHLDNSRRLTFGIEQYFVPEGKGHPAGKLVMEVAIHPDGQAQIRQLYSDGKPWP